MRRPALDIERHDGLLALAQDEARRRGWKAKITGRDIDPDHEGIAARTLPGAGTLVVSCASRSVAIPYHLPESHETIRDAIDEAISGQPRYSEMLRTG